MSNTQFTKAVQFNDESVIRNFGSFANEYSFCGDNAFHVAAWSSTAETVGLLSELGCPATNLVKSNLRGTFPGAIACRRDNLPALAEFYKLSPESIGKQPISAEAGVVTGFNDHFHSRFDHRSSLNSVMCLYLSFSGEGGAAGRRHDLWATFGANLNFAHVCCFNGSLRCLTWLLDKKEVDFDQVSSKGWTPLAIAVYFRRTDIIKTLLKAGVSRELKMPQNSYYESCKNVTDLAKYRSGDSEIIPLLSAPIVELEAALANRTDLAAHAFSIRSTAQSEPDDVDLGLTLFLISSLKFTVVSVGLWNLDHWSKKWLMLGYGLLGRHWAGLNWAIVTLGAWKIEHWCKYAILLGYSAYIIAKMIL
jgi:hypothetical protein